MLGFDIRSRQKRVQWIKVPKIETEIDDFPEETFILEEDYKEEKLIEQEQC